MHLIDPDGFHHTDSEADCPPMTDLEEEQSAPVSLLQLYSCKGFLAIPVFLCSFECVKMNFIFHNLTVSQ